MKRFALIFWSVVIAITVVPIVAGIVQNAANPPKRVVATPTPSPLPLNVTVLPPAPHPVDTAAGDVVVDRTGRPNPDGTSRIAIVVGPAGGDSTIDGAFAHLGVPLTIAVDPRLAHADALALLATANGKTLYVWADAPPSAKAVAAWRSRFPDMAGIASQTTAGMATALSGTGLAFLDERGDAQAAAFSRAAVPLVRRDITVDERDETGYVGYMLGRAVDLALTRGEVVVWMRPRAASLHALRSFVATHAREIVPLSP